MASKLDSESRNILTFKPNITFVEPDQQDGVIEGEDFVQLEDVQAGRQKIKKLAEAVNKLATGVQARVDQRASGIVIQLDSNADQDAIQAMRRRFPDADPTKITYDQYRQCRNGVIAKGIEIGDQALVRSKDVESANNILAGSGRFSPGGYRTNESTNGGLRPELDTNAYIIPPINVEEVQISLICILVNFIWKNFIKATIVKAAPPVSFAFQGLPDKLCEVAASIDIPGLLILGEKPDDLLTGKVAAEAVDLITTAANNPTGGTT
jgi:hypothetical protein